MTLRDRTNEVLEEGRARRGEFQPETGSVPLRLYQYWAKHVKRWKIPERENFCHYWRVVALWAPLMWVRRGFIRVFSSPITYAVLVTALIIVGLGVGLFKSDSVQQVLIGITASAWCTMGVIGAFWWLDVGKVRSNSMDKSEKIFCWSCFAIALPVALVCAAVFWPIRAAYLFTTQRWTRKHDQYLRQGLFGTVILAAGVGFVAAMWGVWDNHGLIGISIVMGGIAALVMIAFAIPVVADFIKGKRALAEARRAAAEQRRVDELLEMANNGVTPTAGKERKPSRIGKFFRGVGDMVIFTAQVIRVNKWKICPIVTIPTNKQVDV